ncbi:hypothetical protein V5O48_019063, partial [Marasmius crinis-equi]
DIIIAGNTLSGRLNIDSWLEATDLIRHIHNLSIDDLPPLPDNFLIPLTKLKVLLWTLPDEPSDSDFGFLDSYRNYWEHVKWNKKAHFIETISHYINEYPSLRGSHNKCDTNTPLVTHRKGLELIGFLYTQWNASHTKLDNYFTESYRRELREAWMKALECVMVANKLDSSDELKAMFTLLPDSRSDSPLDNTTPQQIQGDNMTTEGHTAGGDRGTTVECHSRDGEVPTEAPNNEEAIELVALKGSVRESGGGSVGHTSQKDDSIGGSGADNNV